LKDKCRKGISCISLKPQKEELEVGIKFPPFLLGRKISFPSAKPPSSPLSLSLPRTSHFLSYWSSLAVYTAVKLNATD
jgi:hypothetical protein